MPGGPSLELRYPGQYSDEESGLHYNRFRYYDPRVGRYISADPVGQWDDTNVYAYVGNDSINGIDPYGLGKFGAAVRIAGGG